MTDKDKNKNNNDSTNSQLEDKKVVVAGGGVIGLSLSYILKQKHPKLDLTIVYEYVSGKAGRDPRFASPYAGAHWRSVASNTDLVHQKYDRDTWNHFMELVRDGDFEDKVKIVRDFEYYDQQFEEDHNESCWYKDLISNYRVLEKSELPQGTKYGVTHDTICINTPRYLSWLETSLKSWGVKFIQKKLAHIEEAFLDKEVDVVINCTGLGAATLGGVEDKSVIAARGQTVLVDAPHIDYSTTKLYKGGEIAYVIPRGDGTVLLGGTFQLNNYQSEYDLATANQIIQRCEQITQHLGSKAIKFGKNTHLIANFVGFRPVRKNGIRNQVLQLDSKRYLAHCYGHGGFGYQSSWGSVQHLLKLLETQIQVDSGLKSRL